MCVVIVLVATCVVVIIVTCVVVVVVADGAAVVVVDHLRDLYAPTIAGAAQPPPSSLAAHQSRPRRLQWPPARLAYQIQREYTAPSQPLCSRA